MSSGWTPGGWVRGDERIIQTINDTMSRVSNRLDQLEANIKAHNEQMAQKIIKTIQEKDMSRIEDLDGLKAWLTEVFESQNNLIRHQNNL